MIRSYKYRLYPNNTQSEMFNKTFGCVRFYWNNLTASFNGYDKEINPNPEYKTQKELKGEYEWLGEVSAAALQQKKNDFDQTKRQYFNKNRKVRIGRISFKKKGVSNDSYRLPNQKFKLLGNKIQLEKIGKVRIVVDREIPNGAKLNSVTITKNSSNQYFASINFEYEAEVKTKKSKGNVGIDLGLKSIATLSNGVQFSNPKKFLENQKKLKKAQQHLSRKVKGSNRRNKQKLKVARLHQKVVNQRDWHLHNISRYIMDNFNEIGMEDLNIKGMMKNRKLAKSIGDTSMSKLKTMIEYKQKEFGKNVVFLDRFEASTKECSCCGHKQDMKLSDRIFSCNNCGFTLDRDVQAAIVIRNKTVGVNAVQRAWSDDKTILHENVKWRLLRSA